MNHLDFLLGWDVESTGGRGRLPAGLVHMEADFLPFFSLSSAKTYLVLCQMLSKAPVVIFIEHPQCTKHNVPKALLSL